MWVLIYWGNVVAIVGMLALAAWQLLRPQPVAVEEARFQIGDITAETMQYYCGYDYMKPILVAIRGKVIDVTSRSNLYGPGKELHVYAGKEISRALALDSVKAEDVGSAQLHDLGEEEIQKLEGKLQEMTGAQKMAVVGQVVPLREMTLAELCKHDGSDPALPLMLSIEGVVFNITKGQQFYGPGGVYPFAGHECARALALMSTEVADCNANLEGLSHAELETLRDWKGKFYYKYPIVGKLVAA